MKSGHVLGFLLCKGVINGLDGGEETGGKNKYEFFQVHEPRIQQGVSESPKGTVWMDTTETNCIDAKKCTLQHKTCRFL